MPNGTAKPSNNYNALKAANKMAKSHKLPNGTAKPSDDHNALKAKAVSNASAPEKKKAASKGKLVLAESLQSALIMKMKSSDPESNDMVDTVMKSCDSDAETKSNITRKYDKIDLILIPFI